jgi:hypothetical protein
VDSHESPDDSRGRADDELPHTSGRSAPEPVGRDVSTMVNMAAAMIIDTYMTSHSIFATVVVAVIVLVVALALG